MDGKDFNKKVHSIMEQISDIDIASKLDILGLQKRDSISIFNFFDRRFEFNGKEFVDPTGNKISLAVQTVLLTYLLQCPEKKPNVAGKLVSFREFADSGPLFSRFCENTGKIIETTFSRNIDSLRAQCLKLGGNEIETNTYDLSIRFRALPKVPVFLNFNDKDEMLPANAGFLYYENANKYLDLESLMITCTYLTGCLIRI